MSTSELNNSANSPNLSELFCVAFTFSSKSNALPGVCNSAEPFHMAHRHRVGGFCAFQEGGVRLGSRGSGAPAAVQAGLEAACAWSEVQFKWPPHTLPTPPLGSAGNTPRHLQCFSASLETYTASLLLNSRPTRT